MVATPPCSSSRAKRFEAARHRARGRRRRRTPRSTPLVLELLRKSPLAEDPERWTRIAAQIQGVTEETTTGVHRLERSTSANGLAALPGDQRQRLGDEVEVRQQVRHPALAHRRHQPRGQRAHRWQDGRRVRLRRRRQGFRGVVARSGCARRRHRGRPHQRAAGRDGRFPGRPASRTSSRPPTSSSPRRATRTSSWRPRGSRR